MDFFCFGEPKSGTTWLQALLDSHPDISCRPEDNLEYFIHELPNLYELYNGMRKQINTKTAQYDLNDQFTEADVVGLFQFVCYQIADKSGAQISGTKDNSVTAYLDMYMSVFPDAKFVSVIRNPCSVAVSSWFHNMRVEGQAEFLKRANSLEDWCKTIGRLWNIGVSAVTSQAHDHPSRFKIIRYEDLKAATPTIINEVFAFLGASEEGKKAAEATKFSKLKESGNKFYRSGETIPTELDETMKNAIRAEANELMNQYGYGRLH